MTWMMITMTEYCHTCGGDGKTTHGGPCACGGSGLAADETLYFRRTAQEFVARAEKTERERDAAQKLAGEMAWALEHEWRPANWQRLVDAVPREWRP